MSLEARLEQVRARIAAACDASDRDPEDVTLVAVSKFHTVEDIRRAYELGVRDFGESRPKEMKRKAAELPDDVRWHFLGPIQSNRIRLLQETAHLVHAFDRVDAAAKWARYDAPKPVLLQVNVGEEAQKRGVAPGEAVDAAARLQEAGVPVHGLMALPPYTEDPEGSAPHFRRLAKLLDDVRTVAPDARHLSMGTTQDFEVAIRCGATHVRIGTAVFGPRDYSGGSA